MFCGVHDNCCYSYFMLLRLSVIMIIRIMPMMFCVSRDTTNAVCHAIEAALLHGLKGSSIDKVCSSGTLFIHGIPNALSIIIASHVFCCILTVVYDSMSRMKIDSL